MRPNKDEIKAKLETFALCMADKLDSPKNKNKGDWVEMTDLELLCHLQHEVYELWLAIMSKEGIKSECYDVANFAFMMWDKIERR